MRLLKVYSNKKSFKTVEFNKTGLSFIVAEKEQPDSDDHSKTYNGLGKSLLVRIIHFCLGASDQSYIDFCKKLSGWEFYLDYEINNKTYTAKRATNESKKIVLNNKEYTIKKFNEQMGLLCFDIPKNIEYLSFRSLIPFFIRPNKESYVAYNKPGKTKKDYQTLLYNAFLLGLDVSLVQKKQILKTEKDRITNLETNFKNDSLLKDFFTGNKDASLTLVDLEERIKRLDSDLRDFKVAEDYKDVQLKADKVEKELFSLNNSVILLQNNIENINNSIKLSPDISKERITSIYSESKINFSENVVKTLDELEVFYDKLISNRKRRLLEQQNKMKLELESKNIEIGRLQKEFNALMKYLGEHQALDVFVSLTNKQAELKTERENIKKYQELQSEYRVKARQFEKDFITSTEVTEQYLTKIEPEIVVLRDYYRSLAKIFYPDSVAGITIESNNGENQSRFNIDAKIESDASDGINNVKIFCYDLTILFKGHNHKIDFIFHDSRLFSDTDERQKADMFKTVYQKFLCVNKQYIATVNQNQLDEIKKYMSKEDFEQIITQNRVLTLTDKSDKDKLLGIKVDIDL